MHMFFLGMSSLKQPLKIMRHNGIPIILHNKIQKKELKETATKDEKPKKPIVANSAQIKVNIYIYIKGFGYIFKLLNWGFVCSVIKYDMYYLFYFAAL